MAHALVQPAAHVGVSDVFHQPHRFHEFSAGQGAWVVLNGEKPHGHIGILRGVTARIREHRHSEHLLIAVQGEVEAAQRVVVMLDDGFTFGVCLGVSQPLVSVLSLIGNAHDELFGERRA